MAASESVLKVLRPTNADGMPVIITALDSGSQLILSGRDLPNKGVELVSKLRYEKTYYPGVNEATFHVLGQEQDPIVLNGRFYDRSDFSIVTQPTASLGNPFVGGPRLKAVFLQELFDNSELVRLQWGSNIDVEGYITEINLENIRHNIIGYSITIDPLRPFSPSTRIPANSILGVDQQAIGLAIDRGVELAKQVLDAAGGVSYLHRRFSSRSPGPDDAGQLPDTVTNTPFFDTERTEGLPEVLSSSMPLGGRNG